MDDLMQYIAKLEKRIEKLENATPEVANDDSLFKFELLQDDRVLNCYLAWDKDKHAPIQRSHTSDEYDRRIGIGYLWEKYSAEIIEHVQAQPKSS